MKEKLELKAAEVRLQAESGYRIFFPDEMGQVSIISADEDRGKITKRGVL